MALIRHVSRLCLLLLLGGCGDQQEPQQTTDWLALDAWTLEEAIIAGRVSAETVTNLALDRIRAIDDAGPALNAVMEINPDALGNARELDRLAQQGAFAGPLHGLPVILKANIDTGDAMATTAGSLALAAHRAPDDAALVRLLREAGAVIIAKANLSEWANFRGENSSSGWSSLGGQTRNPYVLDRNPCGSSSGSAVAVAAMLAPLAVGTETDGSIVCPAGANGVVGIKPTRGSVSQDGIIPISHTQDIAGPLARTVRDAALLLAVMQDRPVTALVTPEPADLSGYRIGVLRDYFGAGSFPGVETAYAGWLAILGNAGAGLVDPLMLPVPEGVDAAEMDVLLYEFKADLDAYLADADAEPGTLADLIDWNNRNTGSVMAFFGQELFERAQAMADLSDPGYLQALSQSSGVMQALLQDVFDRNALDVIVAPANGPAWVTDWAHGDAFGLSSSSFAAVSGYPSLVVPAGLVNGLPIGLAFIGRPDSEALLVKIGRVFERRRGPFPAPGYLPTVVADGNAAD